MMKDMLIEMGLYQVTFGSIENIVMESKLNVDYSATVGLIKKIRELQTELDKVKDAPKPVDTVWHELTIRSGPKKVVLMCDVDPVTEISKITSTVEAMNDVAQFLSENTTTETSFKISEFEPKKPSPKKGFNIQDFLFGVPAVNNMGKEITYVGPSTAPNRHLYPHIGKDNIGIRYFYTDDGKYSVSGDDTTHDLVSMKY